jgi:tRNA pseudouridine32 synthase/23S rRNA pseudouridine746 synthase
MAKPIILADHTHTENPKLVFLENNGNHGNSEVFEYPHAYIPTSMAQEAASHLQGRLKEYLPGLTNANKGRMFGVLVVQTVENRLAYLSAYSGELQPELETLPFVPPVFHLPKGVNFPEMAAISAIGREINALEQGDAFLRDRASLKRVEKETGENIHNAKRTAQKAKEDRRQQREKANHLGQTERQELFEKLARQSAMAKLELKRFIAEQERRLEKAQAAVNQHEEKINELKARRKAGSAALQEAIFQAYVFQNSAGQRKDVKTVFSDFGLETPPAGAGECAAPKLFQYAFQHNLKPVALAEFWWGASPHSVVREHGRFYPACRRKCEPILSFMLRGMPVKSNPFLDNSGADKELEVLYQDAHVVVVNKPAGLLSVPGKHIADSVQTRVQQLYPEATGPLIVHRLDRDASGIMVIALSKAAHKHLQRQFLDKTIHKTYVAILEKAIDAKSGAIDLPLILDINHRPRQMVHYKYGKPAKTVYQVLEKDANRTLVQLNPVTGRSHQLRVHCAHQSGLHAPILGDNLHGSRAERLYLHAEQISFTHPITNQPMEVKAERPFSLNSIGNVP